jgi:hypothetical protein
MSSSISGSDGQYNYYQQQINDQNEDNTRAQKKAKQREEERIADLQRKQENELRAQREEAARAVTRAKESAAEALKSERESSKQQARESRKNTYDRFGQFNADNADLKAQLEEMQQQNRDQKIQHNQAMQNADKNYEDKLAEREHRMSAASDKAVADVRQDLENTLHSTAETQHSQAIEAARDSQRRYDNLNQDRLQQYEDQKRRYNSAFEESKNDYNRKSRRAQPSEPRRLSVGAR